MFSLFPMSHVISFTESLSVLCEGDHYLVPRVPSLDDGWSVLLFTWLISTRVYVTTVHCVRIVHATSVAMKRCNELQTGSVGLWSVATLRSAPVLGLIGVNRVWFPHPCMCFDVLSVWMVFKDIGWICRRWYTFHGYCSFFIVVTDMMFAYVRHFSKLVFPLCSATCKAELLSLQRLVGGIFYCCARPLLDFWAIWLRVLCNWLRNTRPHLCLSQRWIVPWMFMPLDALVLQKICAWS